MPDEPTLYVFAGLPGTGKSTLAQAVARHYQAVYVRIDTIEQALRDFCAIDVQGEGYGVAYRIVSDNLRLGRNVVADSCNPIELTRRAWEQVAHDSDAAYFNIEIICSDLHEHRRRVETRVGEVAGLTLPTWQDVEGREYDDWTGDRIVVDTAERSAEECANDLLSTLRRTQ